MDYEAGQSGAFQVGDVVNVVAPPNYEKRQYGFGIDMDDWDILIHTNPHTILDTRQVGGWKGYVLSDSDDITGSHLCWPHWGLELISINPTVVDDLL